MVDGLMCNFCDFHGEDLETIKAHERYWHELRPNHLFARIHEMKGSLANILDINVDKWFAALEAKIPSRETLTKVGYLTVPSAKVQSLVAERHCKRCFRMILFFFSTTVIYYD